MSGPRRYAVVKHPDVQGAWTVQPYDHGTRLLITNKARAEAIATQRNNVIRAREGSKILGDD